MSERIDDIFDSKFTVPIIVGLLSFGAGICGGLMIAKRLSVPDLGVEYMDEPEDTENLPEEPDKNQASFDLEGLSEYIENEKKLTLAPPTQEPSNVYEEPLSSDVELSTEPAVPFHIFDLGDGVQDHWDYVKEENGRTDVAPYVLHRDEFYNEERGYYQSTLTYYAGDDIMVDQNDAPVYNYTNHVGPLLFGHGSGDPNVFYARDTDNQNEYEVVHDDGFYAKEVLGLEDVEVEDEQELKHSTVRKFRIDD